MKKLNVFIVSIFINSIYYLVVFKTLFTGQKGTPGYMEIPNITTYILLITFLLITVFALVQLIMIIVKNINKEKVSKKFLHSFVLNGLTSIITLIYIPPFIKLFIV